MSGALYVCGTPIGNLEDISLRVLRLLKEADVIAAEDTRHTLKLLNHYGVKTPLISYHRHNAAARGPELLERLFRGQSVALVTDAGMPAVSDPGGELVALCREHGVPVTAAPGPTAATTALALSGLPVARFVFEGFLPQNKKERRDILRELRTQPRALVFYEAPHHLRRTLADMREELGGGRSVALAREMTKKFEEVLLFTLAEACEYYETAEPKGEYVIVARGFSEAEARAEREQAFQGAPVAERVKFYESEMGLDRKDAMKAVAKERGVSKSAVYAALHKEDADEEQQQKNTNFSGIKGRPPGDDM